MKAMLKRLARQIRRFNPKVAPKTGEQPAAWYDAVFANSSSDYRKHYTASCYYFIWTVIVDRIPKKASVLEIGCGPGQLAQFLADRGIGRYVGFDFSPRAIELAKQRGPALEFHVADALETPLLDACHYDTLICTEVLEHIEADLQVLVRIREGVRCLLTVPNFPYVSHVRHFCDADSVAARYGGYFHDFRVDTFWADAGCRCFFLLEGRRNSFTGQRSEWKCSALMRAMLRLNLGC